MTKIKAFTITLIILATATVIEAGALSFAISEPSIQSQIVRWDTSGIHSPALRLRVTGPDRYVFEKTFESEETVHFLAREEGEPLADGTYNWEIAPVTNAVSGNEQVSRDHSSATPRASFGTFAVRDGEIMPKAAATAGDLLPQDFDDPGDIRAGSGLAAGNTALNPADGQLQLSSGSPNMQLIDTDSTHNSWALETFDGHAQISILGFETVPVLRLQDSAPINSLYIDQNGLVGFRTSTPARDLHVLSSFQPGLRLEQTGIFGIGPHTWDIAGDDVDFMISSIGGATAIPFRINSFAPDKSLYIGFFGDIGIGTDTPNGRFHIVGTDNPRIRLEDTVDNANDKPGLALKSPASNGGGEWRFETDNAGNFQIDYSLSAGPEIVIIDDPVNNGQVKINGNLVVQGTCTGCDAVFQSGYRLESIEEHASLMWANSYLPAVGPTPEGKTAINVFEKTVGILQELEKAHIYIAQLDEEKRAMEKEQSALRTELAELRALVERLLANPPTDE